MKKSFWVVLISALTLAAGVLLAPEVAYGLPYITQTTGPNQQLSTAPDIYVPESRLSISSGSTLENKYLSSPQDMVFDDATGLIYIADTSNHRIVTLDKNDSTFANEINSYVVDGQTITLKEPTGVAINSDYLFIADKRLERIVLLNKGDFSFVREIRRPTSELVGALTKFIPLKLAVDDRDNVYAVLEGSTKGIMQLDINGNFIGYIGVNETKPNLLTKLQKLFNFSNDDGLLSSGQAVTNVSVDSKGLVYTVTNKSQDTAIKKLNTAGNAILSPQFNEEKTVEVFIDNSDNIFSIQSDGFITVFDSYGSLLFRFGGRNEEEILGSLKSPSAIAVSKEHEIIILDKEANLVLVYKPTAFAELIFKAVNYYKDGLYLEGESYWLEVLRKDSRFILAYRALGKASMKRDDYTTALKQFKLAEDKTSYSDAYWKIRDRWIRENLGYVLIPVVALVAIALAYKVLKEKKPKLVAPIQNFNKKINDTPVLGDVTYGFKFVKHPADSVYEIKSGRKGSVVGATVLYLVFVIIQILKVYLTGYLFNNVNGTVSGIRTILLSVGVMFSLVLANYFVASVSDGEGKLKATYISFIYALVPYLILAIPIFLVSRVLTYNESFIYYVLLIVAYGWSGINLILTVMELHDYGFWKAILNIILTVICLVFVVVFLFIIYLLGYQLIEFIISLFGGL